MEQVLKPLYEIFSLHNKIYKIAVGDISEDDAQKRITGKGNPFIHIAGHVASNRFFIASLLGLEEENPLADVFNGKYEPGTDLPSLEEVDGIFDEITPGLMGRLQEVGSEHLSGELPQPFPIEEQNILGGVSFLAEHESYHIGQMGYLRVQLGYRSIYDTMFDKA